MRSVFSSLFARVAPSGGGERGRSSPTPPQPNGINAFGERCRRGAAVAAALLSMVLLGGRAWGGDSAEPTYGRVDGDLCFVVGAGAVVAARGPRAAGELRVRYLESSGIFATYEDASLIGSDSEPSRVIAAGFDLRPLFLYRWLRGLEAHRARLDLAFDSIGLEMGVTASQPAGGALASRTGIQVGLGVEVPFEPHASGAWVELHGGMRWGTDALAVGTIRDPEDRSAYLTITLAWHQVISAHLVDVGDEAPR